MRVETSNIKDLPGLHRMGHTCANLNGDLLFIWGGTDERLAHVPVRNNHLWIYETLTGYWRHRSCSGECPPYLSGSTSTLIGQKMYVFGGHSTVQDNWLNCLYCLDLDTFVWTDLGSEARAEPTKPIRSDKCVSWSYDGRLYVFGGYGWSQTEHLLQILDRQKDLQLTPDHRWPKFGWNNQLVEFDPRDKTWRWPSYSGRCPSARAAHSGALIGSKYFLFGGRDCRERLNDLYTFDMITFQWSQVAVFADPDSLRLERPIRHLLDAQVDGSEDNEEELMRRLVAAEPELRGEDFRQEEQDYQMVDEIQIDEELTPSPSSSARHFQEPLSTGSDDDEPDYPFDYPHPSHLLERWSLSSNQSASSSSNLDNIHCLQNSPSQLLSHSQSSYFYDESLNQSVSQQNLQDQQLEEEEAQQPAMMAHAQLSQNHLPNPNDRQQSGASKEKQPPQAPAGRSFSSFTPISEYEILLYGGISSQEENLSDCWVFNAKFTSWMKVDHNINHPRLWHTAARTKNNEVVVVGGSCSNKVDEFCSDVLTISMEPKSLKKLALDTAARSVKMRTINRAKGLPSTICKLIRLRKQAIALTTMRRNQRPMTTVVVPQ